MLFHNDNTSKRYTLKMKIKIDCQFPNDADKTPLVTLIWTYKISSSKEIWCSPNPHLLFIQDGVQNNLWVYIIQYELIGPTRSSWFACFSLHTAAPLFCPTNQSPPISICLGLNVKMSWLKMTRWIKHRRREFDVISMGKRGHTKNLNWNTITRCGPTWREG